MDREQSDIIIDMSMHVREVLGELLQMVADNLPLLVILVEHTFLCDILDVFLRNSQWALTVIDVEQHFTGELEFRSVIYHLLHTKGNAELCLVRNLCQSL